MNKILIAFVTAAMFLAGSAQALTIYDKEGTKLDFYGRAYLYFEDAAESEVGGETSRFGFKAMTKVDEALSVFANAEFRYSADARTDTTFEVRNTYLGVKGSFGQVMVGNFDSIYYQVTTSKLDFLNRRTNNGLIAIGKSGYASHGDSVAYISNPMANFTLMAQARHYAGSKPTVSGDGEFVFQLATCYAKDNFNLGLAYIAANKDAMAATAEDLLGLSATWKVSNELNLRAVYESQDSDDSFGLGVIYNYGKGDLYATLGQDRKDDSYVNIGASWKFSKPMFAFFEYGHGDALNATGDDVITLGVRYDF